MILGFLSLKLSPLYSFVHRPNVLRFYPVRCAALQVSCSRRTYVSASLSRSRDLSLSRRELPLPQLSAADYAEQLVSSGKLSPSDVPLLHTLTDSRAALFARVLAHRTRYLTFVLDGVHGAHNLAAIARSCDAWGVQDLHIVAPSSDSNANTDVAMSEEDCSVDTRPILERFATDKSVRSVSKNCHKWLTIREHATGDACILHLRKAGYKVYVSSLAPDAHPVQEVDVSEKCAFVFGNELLGVTQYMQNAADGRFTIPMVGFVESMNVSVAVATTASLTIPRVRIALPDDVFFLSQEEARALAHQWLLDRPRTKTKRGSSRGEPPIRGNVTRMGNQTESAVLKKGLFAPVQDVCPKHSSDLWKSAFRLNGNTGGLLTTYFVRRKFGALGDKKWENRCDGMVYFIAGSHALSCEAALRSPNLPKRIERSLLNNYFRDICKTINMLYEPLFDKFAEPSVPLSAPESDIYFQNASNKVIDSVVNVLHRFASDVFQLNQADVCSTIENANIIDVCRSLTDSMRCTEPAADKFEQSVSSAFQLLPELRSVLFEREGNALLKPVLKDESLLLNHSRAQGILSVEERALLHVALRLYNAAFISSEIHQAAWDRTKCLTTSRVRAIRCNTLEGLACEAYSEMLLLNLPENMSLFRVAAEWYRPLWILKKSISNLNVKQAYTSQVNI